MMMTPLTLFGLAVLPSFVEEAAGSTSEQARLIEAFHSVRVAEPPPFGPLAEQLAGVALQEQAFVLDVLVQRSVPAFGGEGRQVLSENQEGLILATLSELPASPLRGWAAESLDAPDPAHLTAGLLVLGAVGEGADLLHALEQLGKLEEEAFGKPQSRAVLSCFGGILERDSSAMQTLGTRWSTVSGELASLLAEAIGISGRAEGLHVFGAMLRERPEWAGRILPHVRPLTPAPRRELIGGVAEAVREILSSEDTELHSLACLVAGDLEDRLAIPDLMTCLAEGSPPVRDAAMWALRRIAGGELAGDALVLDGWYAMEKAWFANEWRQCRNALRSADKARVLQGLREFALHPLYRHESTDSIGPVLKHRSAQVRLAAVQTLMELGSPASVSVLIDSLEDRDAAVREASHEALQVITGLKALPDPQSWLELAFERGYLIA